MAIGVCAESRHVIPTRTGNIRVEVVRCYSASVMLPLELRTLSRGPNALSKALASLLLSAEMASSTVAAWSSMARGFTPDGRAGLELEAERFISSLGI